MRSGLLWYGGPKKPLVENHVWLGVAEPLLYHYPADPYLP